MSSQSVSVVLSFFSPVAYELPVRHFHAVVQTLNAQGVPLVVTQAVFPGQNPQPVPSSITQANYETKSLLFHKERLWNLGAKLTDSDAIIWLDADVVFSSTSWLEQCLKALETADVIQPFTRATWLGKDGKPEMQRHSGAAALERDERPSFQHYHAGFGWGMRRETFDQLGGFFDASVCGNSDSFFMLSLKENKGHNLNEQYFAHLHDSTITCSSYKNYKAKALSLDLRVAAPRDVDLLHLWHGSRKHRQYVSRTKLFTRKPCGEFAVHDAENGLQVWDNEESSNALVNGYFINKRDDG